MKSVNFYPYGHSAAKDYAAKYLTQHNYSILPCPTEDTTHLLLPVPSFDPDGTVKGGGELCPLLAKLPQNITVIGGNLNHPLLGNYRKIDLLKDADYLASNAAITAHCAVKVALNHSKAILTDCSILVIGWGRIGKCLSKLLKDMGCRITVATRKAEDRAVLRAIGYSTEDSANISNAKYDVIFNTSPEPVLQIVSNDILAIELASTPGLSGDGIIIARGLPSKEAPESSGKLIAQSIHRIIG